MASKQTSNKFADMLGDYYKTNREISKEESKREGYKGPFTNREKSMVYILILLLVTLVIKSCFLDEVKNLSGTEEQFKDYVEYSVAQKYDGIAERVGLMHYRVNDIYIAEKNQNTKLNYIDPKTNREKNIILKDRYNARVRGYFLWIMPVKNFSVTAPVEKTETK